MDTHRDIRIARIVKDWRVRAPVVRELVASVEGERVPGIEWLKRGQGTLVVRAKLDGVGVIIKKRDLATFRDRFKCRLRASRAFRQWRGARRLAAVGIPAARPLALLVRSRRSTGGPPSEWLVLEDVPGTTVLHRLAERNLSVTDQHALARAVGVQVGAMLQAGLCNRDHKPSNLISAFEEGVPIVTLIDTAQIRRRMNAAEMVRMLATLLIESIGVNVTPRGAIAFRVLRDACAAWLEGTLARPLGSHKGDRKALRALVRTTARRVDQSIRFHGDPTPKDNPLHGAGSQEKRL